MSNAGRSSWCGASGRKFKTTRDTLAGLRYRFDVLGVRIKSLNPKYFMPSPMCRVVLSALCTCESQYNLDHSTQIAEREKYQNAAIFVLISTCEGKNTCDINADILTLFSSAPLTEPNQNLKQNIEGHF